MIQHITTHRADALKRLLQQYKGKPRLESLIDSTNIQVQEIEDALFGLRIRLDIDSVGGIPLDMIGEIVGIERGGFDDATYRSILKSKIGQNVSNGTPEDVITTFVAITGTEFVLYQDLFPGGIGLYSTVQIDPALIDLIYSLVEKTDPAGVRIDFIAYHQINNGFAMDGDMTGGGFDDGTGTVGGEFGTAYERTVEFAFSSGNDELDRQDIFQGFGTFDDPLVGGQLTT